MILCKCNYFHGGAVMKKRNLKTIISLAAAVFIVCSISVSAMASMDTVAVCVREGQTLNAICQQHQVDFYANKRLIMYLNGFTDPGQLDTLQINSRIVLPASAEDAAAMNYALGFWTVEEDQTARSSRPIPIVAGDAARAVPGDKIAYYVVLYTINPGDTLKDLYLNWGTDLDAFRDQIMVLNGVSNLDQLVVGKMMYLPVNRGDIAGMENYTVLEHTIAHGENTAGICRNYGLEFEAAKASLQCFNLSMDFYNIGTGYKIYIPVVGSLPRTEPFSSDLAMAGSGPVTAITSKSAAAFAPLTDISDVARNALAAAGAVTSVVTPAPTPEAVPGLLPPYENFELPTLTVYDGYAVVLGYDGGLALRLEDSSADVYVAASSQVMQDYVPRPGDYVKAVFTPTDFLLVSIQYVYNVFE